MSESWTDVRLGDLIALQRGHDLPARLRVPGPFPVVGSGGPSGWHNEAKSQGPGVVIGRATNLGRPFWVEGPFWPLNTGLYVKDFRGNDPRFVFHLFEFLDLSGFDSGSVQPMLNRNYIAGVKLRVPPLDEQRRIAGVLGALDDLIETNQRLAESCAGLRRALVRRALAECDEAVPLSSVARFVNGKNFTKGASGRGLPVIRTPEIRRGPDASTVRSDVAAEQDFRASAGDILFVWSGSLMVERWIYEEGLVNQHIFKVIPQSGCPPWLVFALIEHQMPWFLGLAADKATTMGHIQRGHLDALVPWPADAAIRELAQTVEPLWDQELTLRIEIQQLAQTRNELLPLLLSGRVSVREVAA